MSTESYNENLRKLRELQESAHEETIKASKEIRTYERQDFKTLFYAALTDEHLKTLAMEYDGLSRTAKLQIIMDGLHGGNAKRVERFALDPSAYEQFCRQHLHIDSDKPYNDSANIREKGVTARVFAFTKPYKEYPNIVISTAKTPPTKIPTLEDSKEAALAHIIANENFLIAGASGAGKTYLLNYLLQKYYPKDKRLGLVEEFEEIYPPNDLTDVITTPPRVPGQQWNDLQFITEQTNLCRYDSIIVGEVKSSEAWPLTINAASGTRCGATIHGKDPQGALRRLKTLCMLADGNLNSDTVDNFIKDAWDTVIYVKDAKVVSIDKINTVNKGNFSLEPYTL